MSKNKLFSMLGICRKAGQLTLGFDAVAQALHEKSVHAVLLTRDLSRRSEEKITAIARDKSILVKKTSLAMEDVAALTGKASGIVGITNRGLADAVLRLVHTLEEDTIC